jgi:hypothetical protein
MYLKNAPRSGEIGEARARRNSSPQPPPSAAPERIGSRISFKMGSRYIQNIPPTGILQIF